ncbi:MAG: DMT family transporter [Planctomycetaceae bacterium]
MTWMLLSICSAIFLGFYEIAKKASLKDNAVPPVLFFNVLTAAALWLPLILFSRFVPNAIPAGFLRVEPLTGTGHVLLFLKSLIAGSSWIFASFALKHLPMSIAAPIRASSPFWTITIAVLFLSERPDLWQWVGISIILISFYAFSLVGRKEGIHFHRDRWVGYMVIATLLGACSALYDKYLLQNCEMHAATVQAWFSVYLVLVMTPLVTHWYLKGRVATPFHWRWSIPMIALLLLISDFLYFTAIETPGGLISVISPLRRTSIVIAFIAGIRIYGEKNPLPKAICIMSMLVGVYVLSLSRG